MASIFSQGLNEGNFILETVMYFSKTELLHTQLQVVIQAYLEELEATPELIKKDSLYKVLTVTQLITPWDSLKEKVYQGVTVKLTKQALDDRIIMSWNR